MKHYSRKQKNFNKRLEGGDNTADVLDKFTPLQVKVYGDNFEKALRAFRTLVQKERVLSSYKERQRYEKPSDKRRRKRNESVRKQLEFCSKGECAHSEHAQNRKANEAKRARKKYRS